MFVFDPWYLVVIAPGLLLSLWATYKVKSTVSQFQKYNTRRGLTGAEAATHVLRGEGLRDVGIELSAGELSDHYDPEARMLRLSPGVYHGRNVAAVGIAAHEAGHAIQHAESYPYLGLRSALVPMASFGSHLGLLVAFAGVWFHEPTWVWLGLGLFSLVVVFQFITLPVEFDASSRAREVLGRYGIVTTPDEAEGVGKVLDAAALTYVAGALTSLLTLLYYVLRLGGTGQEGE